MKAFKTLIYVSISLLAVTVLPLSIIWSINKESEKPNSSITTEFDVNPKPRPKESAVNYEKMSPKEIRLVEIIVPEAGIPIQAEIAYKGQIVLVVWAETLVHKRVTRTYYGDKVIGVDEYWTQWVKIKPIEELK